MYYKDLSKYCYGGKQENSFNIGWLERGQPVRKGDVPQEFIDKIWKYLRYPVNVYRGFHVCDLCLHPMAGIPVAVHEGRMRQIGYYEIRVWARNGNVYAAPSMIYHYITCHGYKPPQEFIDVVMESEDPDSEAYYQKVLDYWKGDTFWIEEDRTRC